MKLERCLLGAILMGALAGCSSDGSAPPEPSTIGSESAAQEAVGNPHAKRISALTYHDTWRRLWEDHITWTRMVIIGILDSLPGNDAYTDRLLQNYEDMEDALAPYYGDEAAEEFGDLIKDHLTIAAQILLAAKAGATERVDALVIDWRANADALATKMHELNPMNWPLESTKAMWQQHLDVTLAEATAHLRGDFSAELAAWEQVHAGGLMMADLFSGGTIRRFPGSFKASGRLMCVKP